MTAIQATPTADDDNSRAAQIGLLEQIKGAAAAVQAQITATFVASQRAAQAAAGEPADRVGRGIAQQVALARRISPHQAQRYVGWSIILTRELPATYAALQAGQTSESRALTVARETLFLSREDRAAVDTDIAGQLAQWGDRRVERETRARAYRLDPHGSLARARAAAADRHVSLRPAPDCMTRLTALLPVAQGVAAYAALRRTADTLTGTGANEGRGRGQLMADALVERLTGQTTAGDIPVEVTVLITDTALTANADNNAGTDTDTDDGSAAAAAAAVAGDPAGLHEPAVLLDHGPIPAGLARDLIYRSSPDTPRWLRRAYRDPATGALTALDPRRHFTPNQARFIKLRDQFCTTPYCDAPIRHTDHIRDHHRGGPTTTGNGRGGCQACNHAKQAPGWHTSAGPAPGQITFRTPTGHRYTNAPTTPPGARPNRLVGQARPPDEQPDAKP